MNDLHEQAYPYAVGALPRHQAEEFEAHLSGCTRCDTEVTELRDVTYELSQSVATPAPAALRGAVLAAIAQTPQQTAASSLSTLRGSSASGEVPPQRDDSAPQRPAPTVLPLRRSQPQRLPALLAAAAVLAALAIGAWAFQSQQKAQQTAREAVQSQQVAEQTAQQAAARTERLTELLSAPDVKTVSGRIVTTGGNGTVVLSPSQQQAVFVATDLPDLPAGRIYEAWTIDHKPVPAATFSAQDAKTAVTLPPAAFDASSVAITIEPAGGSEAPTTKPIFTVSVPQQS